MLARSAILLLVGGLILALPLRSPAMERPSSTGITPATIRAAAAYSQSQRGVSLIIRQRGVTLHESHAAETSANHAQCMLSITKSLAALACFAAVADGWLDLDEPVSRTIPDWKSNPSKRGITIRTLLDQSAGIRDGYRELYARGLRDKRRAALALPMRWSPGARFDYGPSYYEILEIVLSKKLATRGEPSLRRWIERRVLNPTGAQTADTWRTDGTGTIYLSTGTELSARGLLGVATMVASGGRSGLRQVVPRAFIAEAARGSAVNRMYGLGFWTNQNAARATAREVSVEGTLGQEFAPDFWREACLSTSAPPDLLAMIGSGGQRAYIVPSTGLVIIRLGAGGGFEDAEFLAKLFRP